MRYPGQLRVVSIAEDLASEVYDLTVRFSDGERFGITSQVRRAALSVGANLVEGCSRESPSDFRRFVEIAQGSAMEVRFFLSFAWRKRDIVYREEPPEELHQHCWRRADDLVKALISLRKGLVGRDE